MSKTLNTVRISAGIWRSRLIKFPDAPGLRPTPDRVRQTVFNWLGQDLTGKQCLDLFAGTGVMGFEALSRGAKAVTLIENNPLVFKALQDNQISLNAHLAQLHRLDALRFLDSNQTKFDVVFCDPPYGLKMIEQVLPLLQRHLNSTAHVYVEAEFAMITDSDWQVIKQGKAGNVYYHLLKLNHDI